jgi:hypothetical protein
MKTCAIVRNETHKFQCRQALNWSGSVASCLCLMKFPVSNPRHFQICFYEAPNELALNANS